MAEAKTLLLQTVSAAGLEDDVALIGALGSLAANWVQLAAELEDFDSAQALVQSLAEGASSDAVTQAFQKVGAEDALAILQAQAANLKALFERVPETVQRLLQPIGQFDERQAGRDTGLIAWPIVNRKLQPTASAAGGDGPAYALALEGAATLSIEAGDTWPHSDPLPQALLRMSATGSLKPSGSAALPFSAGQVSVSASASTACLLEYYFAVAEPRSLYAVAAAERLARLPDPFDFDSVWSAFENTDLAGIHYALEGSGEVKVAVSVADAAALGQLAEVQLGATVTAGFTLAGKYFLTFRAGPRGPSGTPQIIASLSRERSAGGSLGVQLGVTVDAAPLAQKVHQVLAGALDRWDDVLKEVKPLLSPGTWLQNQAGSLLEDQAESLIADPALRAAVVRDLQGVLGIGEIDEPELAEWLAGQLAGAVDNASGWAKDRSGAALAVLDTLGRLVPAFAEQDIRPKLQATADQLIESVGAGLESEVKKVFDNDAKALGKTLHRLGATSSKTVADLDAALAGVRAIVDRYDALFRKIVAETEKAVRAKASAAIQIEESRLTGAVSEIEGLFLARSDAARATFEALTRGRIDALTTLIETGGQGADFAVDPAKSNLRRYARSTGKLGIELVLFGFGMTGSELLTAGADVMVDGTGKVQVDAKATLQKRFKGLDAEREIELVNAFSLIQARSLADAPPAADRALGLAVTIGHLDDNLERHEVDRFVGSLVEAAVIAPDASSLASETFTRWAGNPGSNGKIAAGLVLKLALDRLGLARLLGLDANAVASVLPDSFGRTVVLSALANLRENKAFDGGSFDASLAAVQRKFPSAASQDLLLDRDRIRRALQIKKPGTHIRGFSAQDEPFVEAVDLAFGLREMIERLRQIYFSTPELRSDDDRSTWSAEDYRDAERRATREVRGWLQLNDVLFWTNSRVHARTIAFLDTLADLAKVDRRKAFSLTMTRTDAGTAPETVVLTA